MAAIRVTLTPSGGAHLALNAGEPGEVRDRVALDTHEDAAQVAALDAIVLEFDFYGRLSGISVTDSPASILPPALLDAAEGLGPEVSPSAP